MPVTLAAACLHVIQSVPRASRGTQFRDVYLVLRLTRIALIPSKAAALAVNALAVAGTIGHDTVHCMQGRLTVVQEDLFGKLKAVQFVTSGL